MSKSERLFMTIFLVLLVFVILEFVFLIYMAIQSGFEITKEKPQASITLEHLEKQCELTFWTQEGQQTYVPVKMPADDIIYQIKGSDAVPNGLYPSYYKVDGLSLNGKPVYAITGIMPESED